MLEMHDGELKIRRQKYFPESDRLEVDWIPIPPKYQTSKKIPLSHKFKEHIDQASGEKFRLLFSRMTHGLHCRECKKEMSPSKAWDDFLLKIYFPPLVTYLKSKGKEVSLDEVREELAAIPKKIFPYRDYCSEECYKKYRERKRKETRDKKRLKNYQDLPEYERPDGFCKICGKNISNKKAGAVTCCPAHRQAYKRRKDRLKLVQ